ncbi:hypothetical protein E6O75_ATG04799 [Venturia nashicola]|uniref:Uncharacterized protein n=1 Tax=Venturia nashicola TaxID=86259 RepID=A0A4Z1P4D5_9PEZI|nr:hypothetical protein E6O75_ATG04799 [Venturia nashicola]
MEQSMRRTMRKAGADASDRTRRSHRDPKCLPILGGLPESRLPASQSAAITECLVYFYDSCAMRGFRISYPAVLGPDNKPTTRPKPEPKAEVVDHGQAKEGAGRDLANITSSLPGRNHEHPILRKDRNPFRNPSRIIAMNKFKGKARMKERPTRTRLEVLTISLSHWMIWACSSFCNSLLDP